ncbi:MAG: DUF3883 domain-containing protein [Vicinamibacterales bacterium]
MASDYAGIRADNERRYGTDIGRIGPMLLANRYGDRTHFIFELLQNAEDALARRTGWEGSRAVSFVLGESSLRISHSGKPFDDRDVRGICGIAESTKDLTAIGRFGIGFKSVYAFSDRPEIHSGTEDFAIESFVWPVATQPIGQRVEETTIVLPLREADSAAREEIANGLQRLGPSTLLFLREIDEIAWAVEGGPSGIYLRGKPEALGQMGRRLTVLGQEEGKADLEETWLVFSREATTDDGVVAGQTEIAFSIRPIAGSERWSVQAVSDSPLVVFFPTVLATHLGFLVQGPYRTTPSRDNVPSRDAWNRHLVEETATLLVEALRALRDGGLLDTAALRCLPLDRAKFPEGSMFAPLFDAAHAALASEALLPTSLGVHAAARNAKLARTQELRELLSPVQLVAMFGAGAGEMAWLSGEISQDRTPELRQYLMRELGIAEITPESITPKLDAPFLSAQTDDWIVRLYEFLNGQPALRSRLGGLPLVRLEDGAQVTAMQNGRPQGCLPSAIETGFPTVRRTLCATDGARTFLRSLGLTEPDPVDDVVWNVLPRYKGQEVGVQDEDYEADIRRILAAFGTDSKAQRDKLVAALRDSTFVRAIDAGEGTKWFSRPNGVYLATERLKELFAAVPSVLIADDSYACLRGEPVRDLLVACGAALHLQPIPIETKFTWEQRREMRVVAGCESNSGGETIEDSTLRGLGELLAVFPSLDLEARTRKAALLWEALSDVEDRRGTGTFSGTYRWTYYHGRIATFDADFVRQLGRTAWVPSANGNLQTPEFVIFDTLGWKPNPFLLSKIRFKPPILETLAREAGIEPGILDLLKKLGVTSEADLRARLGVEDQTETPDTGVPGDVNDALKKLLGDAPDPTAPVPDPIGLEPSGTANGTSGGTGTSGGAGSRGTEGTGTGSGHPDGRSGNESGGPGKRSPGRGGGRPFISYVGAHPDSEDADPDGLDQAARMALEEKAIALILAGEPNLRRTPTHNPGFDLFEAARQDGRPVRWVEVKAMTGGLDNRPVGLSRTQFDCAREHGDAYWLYVVEHAGDENARVVRIQDPSSRTRTFTFDRGWLDVANVDTDPHDQEE